MFTVIYSSLFICVTAEGQQTDQTCSLHQWKPSGKRSRGRPNRRRTDCIEADLRRLAGVTKCGKSAGRQNEWHWTTLLQTDNSRGTLRRHQWLKSAERWITDLTWPYLLGAQRRIVDVKSWICGPIAAPAFAMGSDDSLDRWLSLFDEAHFRATFWQRSNVKKDSGTGEGF